MAGIISHDGTTFHLRQLCRLPDSAVQKHNHFELTPRYVPSFIMLTTSRDGRVPEGERDSAKFQGVRTQQTSTEESKVLLTGQLRIGLIR